MADRTKRSACGDPLSRSSRLPRTPQLQELSCHKRFHLHIQSPGDPQLAHARLYSGGSLSRYSPTLTLSHPESFEHKE